MKRLAWLLVALGTLLVQVQPVRATLAMPATSGCCRRAQTCCEHPPAGNDSRNKDCATCLAACTGCALVPIQDLFIGPLARPVRIEPEDILGAVRRDPPPLPPPRGRPVGAC